jgi:hypothetical protein
MAFIQGLMLSEYFFNEAVQPILAEAFPHLSYSAARLEWGSDVIGFDTPMSMDHGWGPKLTLFLGEDAYQQQHKEIDDHLAYHLPFEVHGFPTNFGEPLDDGGLMALKTGYPIHHMITITTPVRFFADYLGADIHRPLSPAIWLTIPQQRLRTVRSGRIYHDGLWTLADLRKRFHWYPHDLWLYLMANQWQRISQEEAFLGRTGESGDELGSRLVAARLVQDLMHLAFLMEKQYAPYHKWFGAAFTQLEISSQITPIFMQVLDSRDWKVRESHLTEAYLIMAERHNALGVAPPIKPEVSRYHQRPFMVINADRYVDAILAQITDSETKALPPRFGSIDQISNSTDLLDEIGRCKKIWPLYNTTGNET